MEKAQQARAENDKGAMKDSASLLATNFIQEYYNKVYVENDDTTKTNFNNTGEYVIAQFDDLSTEGSFTYNISDTNKLTVSDSKGNTVTGTILDNGNIDWSNTGSSGNNENTGDDTEDTGNDDEPVSLAAGLYDENDNLKKSWDELFNDEILGIDEEDGYLEIADNNNIELLTGKLVIQNNSNINGIGLEDCSNLTSVIIPFSMTNVTEVFFVDCTGLISVSLPNSLTSINETAFKNCSSLSSITIPEGVTSIGSQAFYGCSSLSSITIPEGVTSIGGQAFKGCSNLTSVIIPSSVTNIASRAFENCTSLTTVNYTGTEEQWNGVNIKSSNTPLTNASIIYNYVPES